MTYPNVLRRWLGTALDVVVIMFVLVVIARSGAAPTSNRWTLAILGVLILLYEPLFTVYACTLGQLAMKMRVRDDKTLARITLAQAYYRIFVKYFLGWISALTIPFQKRRQAIHDLVTDTLVIEARDTVQSTQPASSTHRTLSS